MESYVYGSSSSLMAEGEGALADKKLKKRTVILFSGRNQPGEPTRRSPWSNGSQGGILNVAVWQVSTRLKYGYTWRL